MSESLSSDLCRISSFTGNGVQSLEKVSYVGCFEKSAIITSIIQDPIIKGSDSLLPYKRTEYGQRLIIQARNSVKSNGNKFDLLRNSLDSSPVIRMINTINSKGYDKLVYGLNLSIRKVFLDIKIYSLSKHIVTKYKFGSLPRIINSLANKYYISNTHHALLSLRLYAEKQKLKQSLQAITLNNLFKIANKAILKYAFDDIQNYITIKILNAAIICLQNARKRTLNASFENLYQFYKSRLFNNCIDSTKQENLILKTVKSFDSLKHLLKKRVYFIFERIKPINTFPTLLKFHRGLINCSLREKLLTIKRLIKGPAFKQAMHEKELSLISPIKKMDQFEYIESEQIYCTRKSSLTIENVEKSNKKHKNTQSYDLLEFNKYLL